jgi:predicted nucleic acid-binding protein
LKRFVLDSSVTMAWCFEDESTAYTKRVLNLIAEGGATVPTIWPLEIANAVLVGMRAKRVLPADGNRFLTMLSGLPIRVDVVTAQIAFEAIFNVARDQALSSYDASYLELAMRENLPLATLDKNLRRAAGRLGVDLLA